MSNAVYFLACLQELILLKCFLISNLFIYPIIYIPSFIHTYIQLSLHTIVSLYIANNIPAMSAIHFSLAQRTRELWARIVNHWENVLLLIWVGSRFFQHCCKTKAILLNSPILSNKFAHSQEIKNNKHSDSVPLSLDYISVCREEGCSQLLMCSCLKMKHRHGNPSTYNWHYLLNGLSPAVLS